MIIWLHGPSGAGKSTLGALLAEKRGVRFVDIDSVIEELKGASVEQIFAVDGEPTFRELERGAIAACADHDAGLVVALGAGALHDPGTRSLLRDSGLRVFLDIDCDTAVERLKRGAARPLLQGDDPVAAWKRLYESRRELYSDADMTLATSGDLSTVAEQLAEKIDLLLSPEWSRTWQLGDSSCTVAIYHSIVGLRARLDELATAENACLVTDTNVAAIYSGWLRPAPRNARLVHEIEPGEESKSLASVGAISEGLVRHGVSRQGTVVGVGGGVVTDLSGFVASIYMRGIESVLVPTTLLAQVDAAIGGKTALNVAGVRNLCGSYWQPGHVLICPAFLRTLPIRELRSGIVEAVKIGILHEPALVDEVVAAMPAIERGDVPEHIGEIIRLAIETKFRVVVDDINDSGIRLSLNFGHTFAHALEGVEAGRYTHGEAVAIGMIAATQLAHALAEISERRAAWLSTLLLPLAPPVDGEHDLDALVEAMFADKKRTGKSLRVILPGETTGYSIRTIDDLSAVRSALLRAFELVSHFRRERS